jgi:hypothetical protein
MHFFSIILKKSSHRFLTNIFHFRAGVDYSYGLQKALPDSNQVCPGRLQYKDTTFFNACQ